MCSDPVVLFDHELLMADFGGGGGGALLAVKDYNVEIGVLRTGY